MQRKTKNLITTKSYRMPPRLVFSVSRTAKSLDLTESEFVRQVLLEAVDKRMGI